MNENPRAHSGGDPTPLAERSSCEAAITGQAPARSTVREYVEPRNDIETAVAGILADVLKIARVGALDNLILLGGESLLAAQIAWRIRDRFGCDVKLRSILTGSVADVAGQIAAAGGVTG